ncbi:hypothetical protein N566_13620 [Streptomycetaceae bacterium MP113-05]|nr:hypothetical protein N566_13620 [Streptomycetaceae bacterium MP113-05]
MRRILLATAAATAALSLTACGTTEPAADDAGTSADPIVVTDAKGKKVELNGPAERVVGTEWNVVESLVSLGVDPVGVADTEGYANWDTVVPLQNDPKDIGVRGEPSMDGIASLKPDLIVATTDLQPSAVKQLRKVAPVLEVRSADASGQIDLMTENLELIAQATGTEKKAEQLKADFEAKITKKRKELDDAGLAGTRLAFADGYVTSNQVSVRPFTSSSLIGEINEKLGLENAWKMKGDENYGLATTDVEGLTKLGDDAQFAYIGSEGDKLSTPFTGALEKNSVWKSLPFVKAGDVHRLPDGIWMFGGPKSMEAYIDAVVEALTK